jgi:hypothetical protein
MFDIVKNRENINRWIQNKNFRIKCKKCGMIMWRSNYKLHIKGNLHLIRFAKKKNKINLIVNFD